MMAIRFAPLAALALLGATAGCSGSGSGGDTATGTANGTPNGADAAQGTIKVTIASSNGAHVFAVETARTKEDQERGLMFRTDIPENGGMLFAPYPPSGPPSIASFWMKNTPSPLDIIFIRPDGTIAHIAENTVPQSEVPVGSGEPVNAVLEIRGGRSLDLGIAEGDRVSWRGQKGK